MKIQTTPIDLRPITSTTTLAPKLSIPPEVHFESGREPSIKVIIKIRK
jgi:hypothetical protein